MMIRFHFLSFLFYYYCTILHIHSNPKMKPTQTTCIKIFNVTFVCIFDSLFANKYVCVLEMIVNHVYGHYCLLSLVLSGYCKT